MELAPPSAKDSGPDPQVIGPAGESTPEFVVGIGASAGGIEALVGLLKSIPEETALAYVIIQHMSPDFKTMLPEILSRQTPHHVALAVEGAVVQPGRFYLIPPDKVITIFHGRLLLEERVEGDTAGFFLINRFFESLAKDCGARAIGVILSGTGSDGTKGVKALRENSGYVVVQTPDSSKFAGMPRSAIASNAANAILPLSEIGKNIEEYASGISGVSSQTQIIHAPSKSTALDKVLLALRNHHGIDFSCYQDDLVARRMDRRAKIVGCDLFEEYCEYVVKNVSEINALCDDLLLGVTEFNRHPDSLEQLNQVVFPQFLQLSNTRDTVRVWVVGCSTGEEAFTIGFLLSDFFKKNNQTLDFKIFATDVDDKSLRIASRGIYPVGRVKELDEAWQRDYFQSKDGQAHVRASIRERVVFANHNIIKDAPFPSIDLVTCRNLFIYLKRDTKEQIVRSFQFSLRDQGFLLLGPNEGLPPRCNEFQAAHPRVKLFRCARPGRSNSDVRYVPATSPRRRVRTDYGHLLAKKKDDEAEFLNKLHAGLVQDHLPACLIFNEELHVEFYYGDIKEFCRPLATKASHDLRSVLPDDLFVAVGSLLARLAGDELKASDTVVTIKTGKGKLLQIELVRLQIKIKSKALYLLKFRMKEDASVTSSDSDTAAPSVLQAKIRMLEEELCRAKKEILENRSKMTIVVGQLESSNEELRTTNEELQAGSEELQGTNEELQAVNEELYTVNAECQMRIAELSEMSSDVQNIYEVSEIGTLFVDKNLRIRKFNAFSQKIFHLIPDDIGRPLEHFSSTLRVDFSKKVRSVLKTVRLYQREIVSDDGVTYLMRIAPYRTDDLQIKGVVLVFVDITSLKKAQIKLTDVTDELNLVTQESSDLIVRLDVKGRVSWANDRFSDFFSQDSMESKEKERFLEHIRPKRGKDTEKKSGTRRKAKIAEDTFQYTHHTKSGRSHDISWRTKSKIDSHGIIKQSFAIGRIEKIADIGEF